MSDKTWNEKLDDLQQEVGYVKGEINLIALLGLVGEAGEVLNEPLFYNSKKLDDIQSAAVSVAAIVDGYKKDIRDKVIIDDVVIKIPSHKNFDKELADCFYYLKALATNRGLTLEDLARLSYEKIVSKRLQKNINHANR